MTSVSCMCSGHNTVFQKQDMHGDSVMLHRKSHFGISKRLGITPRASRVQHDRFGRERECPRCWGLHRFLRFCTILSRWHKGAGTMSKTVSKNSARLLQQELRSCTLNLHRASHDVGQEDGEPEKTTFVFPSAARDFHFNQDRHFEGHMEELQH